MKRLYGFVYEKDGKIQVLDHSQARQMHEKLRKEGWAHNATIDIGAYIEHLHNNCEDVEKEIRSLGLAYL